MSRPWVASDQGSQSDHVIFVTLLTKFTNYFSLRTSFFEGQVRIREIVTLGCVEMHGKVTGLPVSIKKWVLVP